MDIMRKLLTTLCLFSALALTISSCSDSGTGTDPNNGGNNNTPDPTLDAVISYSPTDPQAGTAVTLDATSSSDPQSVGYDVSWTLQSKPSGSAAAISNTTQKQTDFTPDVAGDYQIKLEISNASEGISDEATATISATAQSYKELSGTYSADTTLVDLFTDPSKPDYMVVGDVDVAAKMTIEPGVVIYVQEGLGINVNSGSGILVAAGTDADPIVFTGESQTVNGYWKGIFIGSNSVENEISHAEISYAGSDPAGTYFEKAALTIHSAKVNLSYDTISHSGGHGIQTRAGGSEFPMDHMTFEQNDGDQAMIHVSQMGYFDSASTFDGGYVTVFGGSTEGDMDVPALNGANYKVVDWVGFDHRVSIAPGAVFEFGTDAGIDINPNATIIAQGDATNHILFTGTSQVPGAWRGIFISSASVDNIMEYVDIKYGGSSEIATYFHKTNLGIHSAKITLRHVRSEHSDGYGLETRSTGSTFSVESCGFGGNAINAMRIHPDQIGFIDGQTNFKGDVEVYKGSTASSGTATWSNLSGGTYYFAGNVDIDNTVTVQEGARFEMGTDVILKVTGGSTPGVIKAQGTAADPIVFTGRSQAPGAWGGIVVSSGSVDNLMDHVEILYGGGHALATYMSSANLGVYNDGRLQLTNATIGYSANYGIIQRSSHNAILSMSNVTYTSNANTNFVTD